MSDIIPPQNEPEEGADNTGALTDDDSDSDAAMLKMAIEVGVPMLIDQVKAIINDAESVFWQGHDDVSIDKGDTLDIWIGEADDSAALFVNGKAVSGAIGGKGNNFQLHRYFKSGRNLIFVLCDNSGRGRYNVRFKLTKNGRPAGGNTWSGDDQLARRKWYFVFTVWAP